MTESTRITALSPCDCAWIQSRADGATVGRGGDTWFVEPAIHAFGGMKKAALAGVCGGISFLLVSRCRPLLENISPPRILAAVQKLRRRERLRSMAGVEPQLKVNCPV